MTNGKSNTWALLIGLLVVGLIAIAMQSFWFTNIRHLLFGQVVVDPNDPNFDPKNFRFEYYSTSTIKRQYLTETFFKMFPPGTHQKIVDHILLDQADAVAGSVATGLGNTYAIRYQWPNPRGYFGLNSLAGGHVIIFKYNKMGRSIALHFNGARLYGDESQSDRLSYTPEIRDSVDNIMRPLRKKFLGNEDGFLREE